MVSYIHTLNHQCIASKRNPAPCAVSELHKKCCTPSPLRPPALLICCCLLAAASPPCQSPLLHPIKLLSHAAAPAAGASFPPLRPLAPPSSSSSSSSYSAELRRSPQARSRMAPPCALPLVFGLLFLLLPAAGTADSSFFEFSHRGASEKVSTPEEVVRLLKDHAIARFRLYDANHSILRALGNSTINVIVGVHNGELEDLARDAENARVWVETNILPFVRDTNVTAIAVGDEASIGTVPLSVKQVEAMRNLRQAVAKANLGFRIEVTSPRSVSVQTNEVSFASLKSSTPTEEEGFVLSLNANFAKHRRLEDERGFVWCVARTDVDVNATQAALNWTCTQIDCSRTQVEGSCFYPDNIWIHASWAFNAYYNSKNGAADACDFSGTAYVTTNDPSSQFCFFQGTNRALAANTACMQGRTAILPIAVSLFALLLVIVVL